MKIKRNKQNIPIGLEGKYFRSLVEDLDSIDNITDEIKIVFGTK